MEESTKFTNSLLGSWEKICPICGKHFFPTPEHVYKNGKKVFCSYTCFLKGKTQAGAFSKKVSQYALDGTLIKTFDSAVLASTKTGIHLNSIRLCCRNQQKTAGGYLWQYADPKKKEESK